MAEEKPIEHGVDDVISHQFLPDHSQTEGYARASCSRASASFDDDGELKTTLALTRVTRASPMCIVCRFRTDAF